MIDLKPYVFQTLTNALGAIPVHYFYPPIDGALPCVSWYEAENRHEAQADTIEYLTELAFVIDIWSKSAMTNGETAQTIDQAMSAAGFRRAFAHDLYEPETKIHHKTMRYRAISTPEQVLHQ